MINNKKKVYCSAGISHILLYPNGDVYRCMADYNAKRPPLFNAKDDWKLPQEPLLCSHERCYAGCDVDWATKWIYEPGQRKPKTITAQCFIHLWARQTIDKPIKDMIHIVWAPTLMCNYSCMYCGCAVGKHNIFQDFPSAAPELAVNDWINIWDKIHENYTFGFLTMAGGEPLLSKATLPVIKLISEKFAIALVTNLSVNTMEVLRSGIKPPRAIDGRPSELCPGLRNITGSLHPTSKGFNRDVFFGALLYFKNNGFNVTVNFVGHPLQLFLAEEYREWCDRHEIFFSVSPWCGYDNQGHLAKYTRAEEEFLNGVAPPNRKTETQTEFYNFNCMIETEAKELKVNEGAHLVLKGKIKNVGSISWENTALKENEAYKVGGRITEYGDESTALKELRAQLPGKDIMPGAVYGFEMEIDIDGLKKGVYILKLDAVKEHSFWFEDKGIEPLKIKLKIQ